MALLLPGAAAAEPLTDRPRAVPVDDARYIGDTDRDGGIAARAHRPTKASEAGAAPLRAVPPPLPGPRTKAGRAWPAPGPIVAHFGEPGPGLPWPGIRIAVSAAAAVHAPGAGEVLFADRLGAIGVVLIIAHGNEYHSVLAGLGSVDVSVGQHVETGQAIGHMARAPGSDLNLHLELRRNGRPVDPLPWLGVRVAGDGHS